MNKLDRAVTILAVILAVAMIVLLGVGLGKYGWQPLRDLPSWVWFAAVLFFVTMLKRRE